MGSPKFFLGSGFAFADFGVHASVGASRLSPACNEIDSTALVHHVESRLQADGRRCAQNCFRDELVFRESYEGPSWIAWGLVGCFQQLSREVSCCSGAGHASPTILRDLPKHPYSTKGVSYNPLKYLECGVYGDLVIIVAKGTGS